MSPSSQGLGQQSSTSDCRWNTVALQHSWSVLRFALCRHNPHLLHLLARCRYKKKIENIVRKPPPEVDQRDALEARKSPGVSGCGLLPRAATAEGQVQLMSAGLPLRIAEELRISSFSGHCTAPPSRGEPALHVLRLQLCGVTARLFLVEVLPTTSIVVPSRDAEPSEPRLKLQEHLSLLHR